ncbi:hypothetical protein SAMN04488121_107173 [Chitinophaga filiformis]|uniref:Uncharacterized protein n=1 Tax=Chitinophaga filiformis TaxID=104663 RepID=A0A1G7Y287_CHIFI|nr:hypothetical protein SAMN04488121_107173 [Chitinophaga filiformis]
MKFVIPMFGGFLLFIGIGGGLDFTRFGWDNPGVNFGDNPLMDIVVTKADNMPMILQPIPL